MAKRSRRQRSRPRGAQPSTASPSNELTDKAVPPGAPPLPRWAVVALPLAVGGAALAGLLLPGRWPALLLLAVLVVLVWLTSRSWSLLGRAGRLMRVVVLGALAAMVVLRLVG